jgi:hypothetical protein
MTCALHRTGWLSDESQLPSLKAVLIGLPVGLVLTRPPNGGHGRMRSLFKLGQWFIPQRHLDLDPVTSALNRMWNNEAAARHGEPSLP